MGEAQRSVCHDGAGLVVVVARDDQRRLLGKLRNALEHVLRCVAREVRDELVVDRQVRRQNEEVVDAVGQMQVGDEGPHQAGLAHARGEREAQRRELLLEILQGGEFCFQRGENGRDIALMTQQLGSGVERAHEPGKRFGLRWA